jgi:hypothetical protein
VARLGRPRRRTVGVALLAIVLALVGGFAWYVQPQPLLPEATASLASTPEVTFARTGGDLEWSPAGTTPTTGLVVYPGGKVPPEAYGPAAQAIAAQGYLVTIVSMPFNLAVLDIDAGDRVRAAHPEIERWAVAGHSLGGSMAAQHVANRPDAYDGLAFWAAYAATDLSSLDLAATSIYGTLDAGAARMSGPEARAALPPEAMFVPIEGGNHEQMGWYTGQPDDPPATISREEQQAQVVAATVALLDALSGGRQAVRAPQAGAGRPTSVSRILASPPVASAIPRMTRPTPASWNGDGSSRSRMAPRNTVVTGWTSSSTDVITAGSRGSDTWIAR